MDIILANPRGFCAGVDRAIAIVNRALKQFGAPIYVRHELVHNRFVVDNLRTRGAIFVDELDQIPDGATVIFSAHGVSQAVQDEAARRGFRVFDATCPLVTKVHLEVTRHARAGYDVVLIGHAGHPEVEGTMGRYDYANGGQIYLVETIADVAKLTPHNPERLAFATQTTLAMDDARLIIEALYKKFPQLIEPKKDDVCYATQNRQDAVKALARRCDLVLVVGSLSSSNSRRLRELAEKLGTPAYLIDTAADIRYEWLTAATHVGVTAGASAPELLVTEVITRLKDFGANSVVENTGRREEIEFRLPKNLNVRKS